MNRIFIYIFLIFNRYFDYWIPEFIRIFQWRSWHCIKYRIFTQFPGVEILWKGTVSAEPPVIRLKLCWKCAFPQNFHTRKLRWNFAILRSVISFTVIYSCSRTLLRFLDVAGRMCVCVEANGEESAWRIISNFVKSTAYFDETI